ncbi:hypothetical protein GCM10010245_66830 [Streptomyces spectabilis]|nr:hypothetical protein GCM10010245_66830 [Streptomyces spectabilis]
MAAFWASAVCRRADHRDTIRAEMATSMLRAVTTHDADSMRAVWTALKADGRVLPRCGRPPRGVASIWESGLRVGLFSGGACLRLRASEVVAGRHGADTVPEQVLAGAAFVRLGCGGGHGFPRA